MLTEAQIRRYGRHVLLPELGGRGQARVCAGAVRLGGEGLAAETALLYLVAAGVGRVAVEAALRPEVVAHARAIEPACAIGEPAVGALEVLVSAHESPADAVAEGARAALRAVRALAGVAPGDGAP